MALFRVVIGTVGILLFTRDLEECGHFMTLCSSVSFLTESQ